jgi:hypothetical protein
MKIINLSPEIEIEVQQSSKEAFMAVVRVYQEEKKLWKYSGEIDGHFIEKPILEDALPHWLMYFNSTVQEPKEYNLPDLRSLFKVLKENNIVTEPASFFQRWILPPKTDFPPDPETQGVQFGRVFSNDPDQYLDLTDK